ncbi:MULTISPECIES: HEAT repeat domain-containing protein [unclassified Nocardia]|uniref:HEAT repeat domain-containing protein n=1 Tax=unclassified Nocardia TaxID=2637762 RepID=UPI003442B37E
MSTYQSLEPIGRNEAIAMLDSEDNLAVSQAILRLALHDPDGGWVTDRALALLENPDPNVRSGAVTALGHIARIHRAIDTDRVVPALRELVNDPIIGGRVEDALDDITVFGGRS